MFRSLAARSCVFSLGLIAAGVAGCADSGGPPPRDVGPLDALLRRDGGDAAPTDTGIPPGDVGPPDAPRPDAGRGEAAQCEPCTTDIDCLPAHYCATLSGGDTVCLRACDIDLADCGSNFSCVADFSSSIPDPVCAPVGDLCCVDADGDRHGSGVGCLGIDCDETDTTVNESGSETCDGTDENCNGMTDDGNPALLCLAGPHVATTECASGTCGIVACEPNFDDCNRDGSDGCEASLLDNANCRSCGAACNLPNVAVHACTPSGCTIITCMAGFGDCDGMPANGCEQSLTTSSHCGGCGVPCGLTNATSTCATGTCRVESCNPRWGDCDTNPTNGCETPLVTETDCGMCGQICAPPGGSGSCATGSCRVTTCSAGTEDCNMSTADGCETNIRTLTNCGACGVPCSFANASASCAVGACTLSECLPGFGNCDGLTSNGCERTLDTPTNCGACGMACAPANGTGSCSTGTCAITSCNAGFANCDGLVSNGCETPLTTLTNCGACGTACSRPGASATCATGTCEILACAGGRGNCDFDDTNGCETPLTSTANCSACGMVCSRANATPTCSGGSCAIQSCNAGFANCDGVDANGCETALTGLTSCGGCGVTCARANASATCGTGSCRIDFCNPGFANCDGVDSNGCETSLSTLANCGACGTTCNLPNASESCGTGICQITSCSTGYDDCDSNDANGCETSLRSLTDCGGCGLPCSRAGATATCSSGSCSILSCNAGSGNCDGTDANGCETALNTLTNCGGCGTACDLANAAETCPSGVCTLGTCSAGFGNCDGAASNGCETALTTLTSCGTCGTVCDLANASESCATGTCSVVSCSSGFENCNGTASDGCERNTRTLTDCGGCGVPCSRTNASATCATGSCSILSCNAGFGNCDGIDANGCERPLNTLTDCGGCSVACSLPNASQSCASGTCTLGTCSAGFGNCNGVAADGCETPLNTLTNCGSCGTLCDLPGSGESCATGTCQSTGCAAGLGDCDMMSGNGCETPLNTLANCGGCGTTCDLPNATESCSTGSCAITMCSAGFGNCDSLPANGCEAPLNTLTHCGACGSACSLPNATPTCSSGSCAISSCGAGFGNCNGTTADGCEAPLNTLTNCGTCGTACNLPNANESCSTGACQVTTCSAGFGNCNGVHSDGCETNTQTSTANCGTCGSVCSPANATGVCTAGSCGIATCNAGWGNCNGLVSDGCETPLNTLANCGACGMACDFAGATESCATGTCTFGSCSAGFGNCDGMTANGCETPLNTLTNCGTCGTACNLANANESCSTGVCGITSCNPLFGNCDGMTANGCETPLNTTTNCGVCGTGCSRNNAAATCSTGSCSIGSCNAGFGNCDGVDSNGCEVNLTNTATACGTCSTNCTSPLPSNATTAACSSSACGVTACSAGYFDTDAAFANGCECMADTHGDTCAAPTSMGTITDGGSVNRTGNLVGPTDVDWFTVTLTPVASCGFLPTVTISNGGLPIVFSVFTGCAGSTPSGGMTCNGTGESGTSGSVNQTTWEFRNPTGGCGDLLAADPTPAMGTFYQGPTVLFIRVQRTMSSTSCLPYTITVTA